MSRAVSREDIEPKWGWLYALAVLMLGLVGAVEVYVSPGAWRRALEIVVTVATFAVIHVWVRANRRALDMAGAPDPGFRCPVDVSFVPEQPYRAPRPAVRTKLEHSARSATVVPLSRRRSTGSRCRATRASRPESLS
jgi:hypothetical protein